MATRTRAGRMRDRVTFQRFSRTSDGGGGYTQSWTDIVTVWGQLDLERGRERVAADRVESDLAGILRVRSSTEVEAVTTADRVSVLGEYYQIRSIANVDRKADYIEMVVERGVAT